MTLKATAIEYSEELPRILASGRELFAEKILELAELNGITVLKDPDLAEALDLLSPGDYIPEDLFKAVAEVLAFCYRANLSFREKMDLRGI